MARNALTARVAFQYLSTQWLTLNHYVDKSKFYTLFDTSHVDHFFIAFRARLTQGLSFDREKPEQLFMLLKLSWEGMYRGHVFESPQYLSLRLLHVRYFIWFLLAHGVHVRELDEQNITNKEDRQRYLAKYQHEVYTPLARLITTNLKICINAQQIYDLVSAALDDHYENHLSKVTLNYD